MIRRSYACLISPTGFPILIKWHIYIELVSGWVITFNGLFGILNQDLPNCSHAHYLFNLREQTCSFRLCKALHLQLTTLDLFHFDVDFHYNDDIMTTMASQITSLTVVYSIVYSFADQRKHQSSASLAFVRGLHRDRWIPRTKDQKRGKCFHLMTSSCYVQC